MALHLQKRHHAPDCYVNTLAIHYCNPRAKYAIKRQNGRTYASRILVEYKTPWRNITHAQSQYSPDTMKIKAAKTLYNSKYFEARDHLDLLIGQTIEKFMHQHGLKKILDVGCGTGKLVSYFQKQGFTAIGCDNAEEALKISKQIRASATKLPFIQNSFDLVTAISLIEHLSQKDASKFITEAYRVLKPKGFIFLITPNFASPLRLLFGNKWFGYQDPTHITFFTPKSLSILLAQHRFSQIKLRFPVPKNVPFDWYLPAIARKLPMGMKNILTYLMISSPFATYRDSFWIAAQKT